jgi:hypothetical protein
MEGKIQFGKHDEPIGMRTTVVLAKDRAGR